jgi:hypothetical protein
MPTAVSDPALSALQRILVSRLEVDGEELVLSDSEIDWVGVSNEEGTHETAKITTLLTKGQTERFLDKTISFRYGRRAAPNTYEGYVVDISPNQEYQKDSIYDITCLGPTKVMQSGTPRFEVNKTVPQLFLEIVNGYDIGAQTDSHSFAWPALSQTNESDWQFINMLAARIGYTIYYYKGLVRMVKPSRVLRESPVFRSFIKGDDVLDPTRALFDWQAHTESPTLRENVVPSFGYFDGTTPTLSKPITTIPYNFSAGIPVLSRAMVDAYTEAFQNSTALWNQSATARVNGDAALVAGVVISIQVSASPTAKSEFNGLWLVRGVRHSLTHTGFQTNLALTRDQRFVPVPEKSNWFWQGRGKPQVLKDTATGMWRSSWGRIPDIIDVAPTI